MAVLHDLHLERLDLCLAFDKLTLSFVTVLNLLVAVAFKLDLGTGGLSMLFNLREDLFVTCWDLRVLKDEVSEELVLLLSGHGLGLGSCSDYLSL